MGVKEYKEKYYDLYLCRTGRHDYESVCPRGEAKMGAISCICKRCGQKLRFNNLLQIAVHNQTGDIIDRDFSYDILSGENEILEDAEWVKCDA